MIRRLRRRHRWLSATASLAALVGLGVGVALRPPPPTMAEAPALTIAPVRPPPEGAPLRAGDALWEGASIDTAIYPDQVRLTVLEPLRRPDPLLYWAERAAAPGEALPADAILLGAIEGPRRGSGERFALPRRGGALMIFSLAHGEVVARLALEGAP